MPTIMVTDVRLEPWYTVTSGQSPAKPTPGGVSPPVLTSAFKAALAKEVDIGRVRQMILDNPYFSSDITFKMAGDAALLAIVDTLNTVRGSGAGSRITADPGRYITYPGGGHGKAAFLVSAVNGKSDYWKLPGLQVKDEAGTILSDFDSCIAIAIEYVVVVPDATRKPPP